MRLVLAAIAIAVATPLEGKVVIEVDRSDLKANIYHDNRLVDTFPVAMGKSDSPTPLGEYQIRAIDFNPDWRSTRDGSYSPPGRSPLGQIRMRYDPPYALHGTWKPESIGTYASLGCIRMNNRDIVALSKLILLDTETWKGDTWFNNMLKRDRTLFHVPLKQSATIRIVE